MFYEGLLTIGIVGKADFNPICDPDSFRFLSSIRCSWYHSEKQSGFSQMRNTGLWSKAWTSYDVVFLFLLLVLATSRACGTLDEAGGW